MKYIMLVVLTITSINCFAIDQRLIDGANSYKTAVKNLKEIEIHMASISDSPEYWAKKLEEANGNPHKSDEMKKFYIDEINESNKQIQDLNIQYNEAKETVQKYEPIKKEYDKQVEWEDKIDDFKTAVLNITGMLVLPLSLFGIGIWLIFCIRKRNLRLLKEGKLTQEQYEDTMQNHKSSIFADDARINPATGLRMIGGCDSGGNAYGSSFSSSSSSMSSASQDYRDRHRWD